MKARLSYGELEEDIPVLQSTVSNVDQPGLFSLELTLFPGLTIHV